MLSKKANEAIRTALAMTVVNGIALNMGRERTDRAEFAAAVVDVLRHGVIQFTPSGAFAPPGVLLSGISLAHTFSRQRNYYHENTRMT